MPKIELFRGLEATIPTLDEAVPAFTEDTKTLFIGSNSGNIKFPNKDDLLSELANVNVNAEVLAARGTYPTLAPRLDNVDSSLVEISKDYAYYKSGLQLKGTVLAVNSTDLSSMQTLVSRCINEYGINFFVIGLLYRQDHQADNSMYAFSDLPTAWSLIDYIKTNFPTVTIAVNNYLTCMDTNSGSAIPSTPSTWFANWKTILVNNASTCQSKGIQYIGIENENSNMSQSTYQSNWQDIINTIHTYGLQVFNSANYWDWQTSCLSSLVDVIGFNFYPQMTINGKNETDTNMKKALYFDLVGATFMLQLTKLSAYNKPIWITEIGCSGNVDALTNTSQTSGFATNTIDLNVPAFYYEYILNFVGKSKSINGMALFSINGLTSDWSFIDNPSGDVVKKYWVNGS